jgi:hypothetical protein
MVAPQAPSTRLRRLNGFQSARFEARFLLSCLADLCFGVLYIALVLAVNLK